MSYSFGIKSLKMGTIDPVTGLGTNLTEVGDIYLDTCDFTRADATSTSHFSQQAPDTPKVTMSKKGIANLKFSIMNSDADTKSKFLGGTVTTLEGKKTWNEPRVTPKILRFYEIETTDGQIIKIYKGDTVGKENFQFRDQGLLLLDVSITPLLPDLAALPATSSTDAAVVA